jgi:putative DNA methylase
MTYKKKLIEVLIPLDKINEHSAREKSIRHGHPSTLHLWWARRPLAAARAVLFAQLVDDPSAHPDKFPTEADQERERDRLFKIIENLVPWENSNDENILNEARAEILKSCEGELPKILDPFGGGGAIPLESLRLGLPTYTGDLNPVAVLIQRAMLEIPQRFAGRAPVNPQAEHRGTWLGAEGLAKDIEYYGKWMQEEAKRRIGKYYPDVTLDDGTTATPIAWIWARTVKSPDPSWPAHVPLVHSWVLSNKPKKPATWIEPVVDSKNKTISYTIRIGGKPKEGNVGRQGAQCLATGSPITLNYIRECGRKKEMGVALIAVVSEGPNGRIYTAPDDSKNISVPRPTMDFGEIPMNPRDFRTPHYGLKDWSDLFADRQLLALTTFSDLVGEVRSLIVENATSMGGDTTPLRDGGAGPVAYGEAVATYLAFAVDKSADYWSSICTWHSSREIIRNTFGRQAIPMAWDFAEINPFSNSSGNWMAMVDWVWKVVRGIPANSRGSSAQRDARSRIREIGSSVIATDPPYYDNISYADLSDYFYVWMRRTLKEIWPDELSTLLTPKVEEMIANPYRAGSKEAAFSHFESGMEGVFAEAADNADERYPATIFYAFKATESSDEGKISTGWETFLSGLIEAGYAITGTWPIRTEMSSKIGMNAGVNMLASSIVLACRKKNEKAAMATRSEFVAALRRELPEAIRTLQHGNIAPVDMAQSAIGPGIKIFSGYSKVVEADGEQMSVRSALRLVNEVLGEILSGEEAELDPDTRFALTWFEQFGHNPGPFGDADVLARAKDTTVSGVCQSGVAVNRDGKVRLVERTDLPATWDPTTDSRLTVWEITQNLIRALEDSEISAAALLRKVGAGMGERARQLAYLLYGICDSKGWAAEGAAYNMLVVAWSDLERQSMSEPGEPVEPSRPDELF